MNFPEELWNLSEGETIVVIWYKDILDHDKDIVELATVYDKQGFHTVLEDEKGQRFVPYRFDTIKDIRELTPAERGANRLGLLEKYVT